MAKEEEEEEHASSRSSDSLIMSLVECRFCCCRRKRLDGFDDMEILAERSRGSYGRVFRCRDRNTGRIVTVKEIKIPADQSIRHSIKMTREISRLKKVNHNNIVRLLNHVMTKDKKHMYLVFEHLSCDLHQYIRNHRRGLGPMTIKNFLYQILAAVAYCHSHRILLGDLKPKNLMIDLSTNIIKLADVGLAREYGDPEYTGQMGTRWYRAPEILFDSPYSAPCDLWSVGCIFGEMAIGDPMFHAFHDCQDELEAIFRVLGTPTEATWPGVTRFIDYPKYGKYNPLKLSIIFANLGANGIDLLTRMLTLDPDKRISANAALEHVYFNDLILSIG